MIDWSSIEMAKSPSPPPLPRYNKQGRQIRQPPIDLKSSLRKGYDYEICDNDEHTESCLHKFNHIFQRKDCMQDICMMYPLSLKKFEKRLKRRKWRSWKRPGPEIPPTGYEPAKRPKANTKYVCYKETDDTYQGRISSIQFQYYSGPDKLKQSFKVAKPYISDQDETTTQQI